MIEVQHRGVNGKDRIVATFKNYSELFRGRTERDFKAFGYNEADRTTAPSCWKRDDNLLGDYAATRYCYVAFDNGKLVTPDRLVGLYRAWDEDCRGRWGRYSWNPGAYGRYRAIKTTNERRWVDAHKDEEFAPKVRAARNFRNLPNAWDDFMSHNDKCWKTQSKRKHQWKRTTGE